MSDQIASAVGAAFNRCGIRYRDFPYRSGKLYFCTILKSGLTFDVQIGEDGMFRLWRFVGTAPVSKAGKRCEYRNPNDPHIAVGIEVTDEGDVSFYVAQRIDFADSRSAAGIDRIISLFINMIAAFSG